MIVGPSTNNKITVTSSAAATVWIAGSASVISTASPPVPDGTNTGQLISASIGAAARDVLVGAASQIKRLIEMSIRNAHASTSTDITVTRTDNTNTPEVIKCTLLPGELLLYNGAGTWLHYDSNGALYPSVGNAATQAEMEAATATNKFVTPAVQHFHPGHPKCWGKATVAAASPTLQVSYNTTSITDTATDQLTVTIATDFSGVHYAMQVSIEAATTTLSATTTSLAVFIRNATLGAGSFIIQACEFDVGAATDPASWHWTGCGDL